MKAIYNNGEVKECLVEEELHIIRHTCAHVLAQAVKRVFPNAIFAYGPANDKGFYYDVDLGDIKITDEDLVKIENEMRKIVKENLPIKTFALSRQDAINLMKERGEIYKVEHIDDLAEDAVITFYQQGEYIDMCVGPHLTYTKQIKAFKLMGISGAYWKNDSNNKMLTRIKGIAFKTAEELERHLKLIEEAERRDHRRIGKEMGLFMLCDEAPGFPFFLPNGMAIKNALVDYWRSIHYRDGYVEVTTPIIMNRKLWETSGHWDHYKDNMYSTTIDEETYCVKPMSCPGGVMVYRSRPHSYRDLPLRVGEFGIVHRHELKGALHGLFRVRCFTQDDAHIFMRKEQITDEILAVANLINEVYTKFGFKYNIELSTRPENSMGSDEDWESATNGLITALDKLGVPYTINEGDGAFYGPKIDFHLEDCLGRTWQCGTIQL
ncbi:MAG: threonine--tRNA ligase, partial [Clostridia bacterium]|nr:threonine--tRNA ligase [Clostridia bacterium]